jgi:hypothetical protein
MRYRLAGVAVLGLSGTVGAGASGGGRKHFRPVTMAIRPSNLHMSVMPGLSVQHA